jgi:hypothetical protein
MVHAMNRQPHAAAIVPSPGGGVAFIVWRHSGARGLLGIVQPGIARGLTRDRLLGVGFVNRLRTILVGRLLLATLVPYDALI